jgi:hypothetical protein
MDDENFVQEFMQKQYLRFNIIIFKEPNSRQGSSQNPGGHV